MSIRFILGASGVGWTESGQRGFLSPQECDAQGMAIVRYK